MPFIFQGFLVPEKTIIFFNYDPHCILPVRPIACYFTVVSLFKRIGTRATKMAGSEADIAQRDKFKGLERQLVRRILPPSEKNPA